MKTLGPVHSVTLNLRPDIEKLALSKPDALDWMIRRIKAQLKNAHRRKVELYVVAEDFDDEGNHRVHFQREIQTAPDEADKASRALRLAGGDVGARRKNQAQTTP